MKCTDLSIKDLCTFSSGHGFTRRDWSRSGLPIIRIAHLNGARKFDYFNGTPESKWLVEPGDLLFAWAGTRGVSFGPTIWRGPTGVLNQHIYRVTPGKGVDTKWLYYVLSLVTSRIERRAHGFKSTLLHVRKSDIENQRCKVPHISEQRSIAAAMSFAESLVHNTKSLIEAKREQKRGLAQRLLAGAWRFPEFKGTDWVELPLGKVLRERSTPNVDRKETHIFSCTKSAGIVSQAERFGKRLASADLARYKVVTAGDLVYDPMLLWDGSIGFVPDGGHGVVSPAYETFTLDGGVSRDFFWVILKSYNLLHLYKKISKGTNTRRRKAHPADFMKLTVKIPPTRAEQDRIAGLLSAAQREMDLLKEQQTQFELYKIGLLSRLLSDETPATA